MAGLIGGKEMPDVVNVVREARSVEPIIKAWEIRETPVCPKLGCWKVGPDL